MLAVAQVPAEPLFSFSRPPFYRRLLRLACRGGRVVRAALAVSVATALVSWALWVLMHGCTRALIPLRF